MPKIKWKGGAKITTLALGLKSDVERASIPMYVDSGEEIQVTEAMVKALQKIHGTGAFTVLGGSSSAAKAEPKAHTKAKKKGKR